MTAVMIVGSMPVRRDRAVHRRLRLGIGAPAFANLIFLPMLWLSGLFIPLPKFLERWAVIWPAFHLNQVALGAGRRLGVQLHAAGDLGGSAGRGDGALRRPRDPAPRARADPVVV